MKSRPWRTDSLVIQLATQTQLDAAQNTGPPNPLYIEHGIESRERGNISYSGGYSTRNEQNLEGG